MEKLEKLEQKQTEQLPKTKIELLECFLLPHLVKCELLWQKIKDKKRYIKLKNLTIHVSKQELKETQQMVKLLLKKNRTEKEVEFIKEQLKDLWKMWTIGTVWVMPWWFIISAILFKLWIDLSPSALKEYEEKK